MRRPIFYFAEQYQKEEPITMKGLEGAIKTALVETLGEPPKRKTKPKELSDPREHWFIHFIGPIRDFETHQNWWALTNNA